MPITEPIDEDELEADLAALEQENLDEKMLKTGTMPVADSLNRLPKAANGERKYSFMFINLVEEEEKGSCTDEAQLNSQGQVESAYRGGRRGGGTEEVAGRDGDVISEEEKKLRMKWIFPLLYPNASSVSLAWIQPIIPLPSF